MAKKAKKKVGKVTNVARRGGRKAGDWKLLKSDDLRVWREKAGISRFTLGRYLGVSQTSVQNWETGHPPSLKYQERLAALLSAPLPPELQELAKRPSLGLSLAFTGNGANGANGAHGAYESRAHEAVSLTVSRNEAVSSIVSAYVASHQGGDLTPADLGGLIQTVKAALA